jgi:hypothetical protein
MNDHPANNDWRIIEEMAGAQLMERMARGEIRSPRDLATIKGIAGRNVRVEQAIARREARREAEPEAEEPSPIRVQLDRLDTRRQRLLADELRQELERRAYSPDGERERIGPNPKDTGADYIAVLTQVVDGLLARSDEAIDARQAAIMAARRAKVEAERERERIERERIEAEREAAREAARPPARGFDHAVNVTPRTKALETLIEEGERMLIDLA